jgi:hypothetical protein
MVFLRYSFPMSNARPTDIFNLCQFTFANGRMCGLPAHPKHNGLCLAHGRRAEPREDDLAAYLASPAGDFITQIDINHVLGKLFTALAANRISSRRAGTLAYIACHLMQTQAGAKNEARRWEIDSSTYRKLVALKYPKSPSSFPQYPLEPSK